MTPSSKSTQNPTERRAAEAQARELTANLAPDHQRLVGALRRALLKRLPTAHELVYEYTSWLVISYSPNDNGYEGVLALRADAKGVKLYFNQGKGLPDPEKLLQGTAQTRWIAMEAVSNISRPAVTRLIEAALARNKVPFARTGRGPIDIRSASAKKKARK